jgi:DNA-binding response OmpR family regulator
VAFSVLSNDRDVLRVLIVDDNVAAAQTTGWMIETADVEYRLAHNATDALAVAADYCPQVALLDIGLPGMNGFDLCAALRAMPTLSDTIYIAQTGWDREDYRVRAQSVGFDHYLIKPVPMEALHTLLKTVQDSVAERSQDAE